MILGHPFVVGELALGNLSNRTEILFLVSRLPKAQTASDFEVNDLIENKRLMGRGIGLVDAHLLASTLLSPSAKFWTRNKKLRSLAVKLGVAHVS